jgi:hypothetical protein
VNLVLQKTYDEVSADVGYLDSILADGAAKANLLADSTLQNVYSAMGFVPRSRSSIKVKA